MTSSRRMLRWARGQVGALPEIPRPWDVEEFARRVAERRRRPIELVPRPMSRYASVATGLWIRRPDVDQIVYDTAGSDLHQGHVILHELSHMLCGHTGVAFDRHAVRARSGEPAEPLLHRAGEVVASVAPRSALEVHDVRVWHRTAYDDVQELQAETLAFVIWQAADLRLVDTADSGASRLLGAFEHHRDGGRGR